MTNPLQNLTWEDVQKAVKEQFPGVGPVKLEPDKNAKFLEEFRTFKKNIAESIQLSELRKRCKYDSVKWKERSAEISSRKSKIIQTEVNMSYLVKLYFDKKYESDAGWMWVQVQDLLRDLKNAIEESWYNTMKLKMYSFKEGGPAWTALRNESDQYDLNAINYETEILTLLGYLSTDEKLDF